MCCNMSTNELMFKLRFNDIYEIQTVNRVILEQNVQMSVIQYADGTIYYPIIMDGQVNQDVLDLIHKDMEWLSNRYGKATLAD
ncbi:DUF421 domain-containing protein [Paenibacillus hunanensis]|nr:DUF421 domain-containing protein [Paenibacillus hunanensis]